MAAYTILNGVNIDGLNDAINTLKDNDELSQFTFHIKNKWINGGHNHTSINDFYGLGKTNARSKPFEVEADEPPALLGDDQGANPVEKGPVRGG